MLLIQQNAKLAKKWQAVVKYVAYMRWTYSSNVVLTDSQLKFQIGP